MKPLSILFAASMALSLAGCGSPLANAGRQANRAAEASGSPFRWEITELPGGSVAMTRIMLPFPVGQSSAGDVLKADILKQIANVEAEKNRPAPEVEEVQLLPDGREVWILKHKDSGLAYIVSLQPAVNGGTVYSVNGPHMFEKRH